MNEVVHTSPTIGSNVEEVVWKNVHFIMWDLGGQESLRAAWNTYYSNTEVIKIINIKNYCRKKNYCNFCEKIVTKLNECPSIRMS